MIFEIHVATAINNGRCGVAVYLSSSHEDYSSSRQMTFTYSCNDQLLGELKSVEIALTCIKNRWKQSPIVAYVPAGAMTLLNSNQIETGPYTSVIQHIKGVMDTFQNISIASPPDNKVQADAMECAISGKTKDTGTMVAE